MHLFLWLLILYPGLHDLHFAAPSAGHRAPVFATPFLHVHTLATECPRIYAYGVQHMSDCAKVYATRNAQTYEHTPFCRCYQRIPCRTTHTLQRRSRGNRRRLQPRRSCMCIHSLQMMNDANVNWTSRISTHKCNDAHVRIHWFPAWLRVNPALHDAHLTAPLTGQAVPVCPTPLLHVQAFATRSNSI